MDHQPNTAECTHGVPRTALTKTGLPRCPMCRRRAMKQLRTTATAPKPQPIQPPLIDHAALAANDDTVRTHP
jgi:hypothetical protein